MQSQAHGAHILFLIRDGVVTDWESLCSVFKMDARDFTNQHVVLLHKLWGLKNAGLLDFKATRRGVGDLGLPEGRIRVLGRWHGIQSALEVNLADLAKLKPRESMVVIPHFGRPPMNSDATDVFVLMFFLEDLKGVFDDHIVRVCQHLNITVSRADDVFAASSIIQDVWSRICSARILVADCTGRNPNVFYEIGIAHAIGKRIILITQDRQDIPFDIRHLRYIEYRYTPPGMTIFETSLRRTIETELCLC